MKYEYLISTLVNNTLHFSSPAFFNDFFDTFVAIDCSSDSELLTEFKQVNSEDYTIQKASKAYVLSLSRNPVDWVMWNMYTVDENEKKRVFNEMNENFIEKHLLDDKNSKKEGVLDIFGICLGFEVAKKKDCKKYCGKDCVKDCVNGQGLIFLDSNDKCVCLPSNEVKYEKGFVQINKIDSNNGKEFLPSNELIESLTHKSEHWQHEEEERIILIPDPLDGKFKYYKCGKERFDFGYKELQDALDVPFRKENLREVIFGYRTSESRKKHVKCLLKCLGYKGIKYKEIVAKKYDNAQQIYFDLSDRPFKN